MVPDRTRVPYNRPFFRLYEHTFLVLRESYGLERALDLMRRIFERALREAYDATRFRKGAVEECVRVLEERDRSVGLTVSFPEVDANRVVYRFHIDPFPNLKGELRPEELDATYLTFKVKYLFGSDWSYRTTKHFWNGDGLTEHVIEKV